MRAYRAPAAVVACVAVLAVALLPMAPGGRTPTAAAAGAPVQQLTTLRMSDLQITSQAGYYIAQDKGYFREEGIALEFVSGTPTDLAAFLAAGQVDVGAGAISAALFNLFARGVSVKIVADAGRNLPNASAGGVALRKDWYDSGAYRGPADLRGKRIAVATQGSAPDIALDRFLASGGLSANDVDIVLLNFPDIIPAFQNGAVEAAYYQEPFTTIALERGLIVRGPIGYDIYPDQQIGVTLLSQRVLDDRGLAQRYMRGYVRGVRDYVRALIDRDPAALAEIVPILIAHTTMKDAALYDRAIPSGLQNDPVPNVQSIVEDQEWYLARGLQQQRVNVLDFVDTSFVEQAVRELGPARR